MILGARALVLDPSGRVLLLHAHDPDTPGREWWELPGGRIEPSEAPEAAVARELYEETGIVVQAVGGPLWAWESRYELGGSWHHRRHTAYLVRLDGTEEVRQPVRTPSEQVAIRGLAWWTLAELAASEDVFLPGDLAARVAGL